MTDVVALVQADLTERSRVGTERYGKPLDLDDGRDWLTEAYEEALDQVIYLRAGLEAKANAVPAEADPWHAIEELAKEVRELREKVGALRYPAPDRPMYTYTYPPAPPPPIVRPFPPWPTINCGSTTVGDRIVEDRRNGA